MDVRCYEELFLAIQRRQAFVVEGEWVYSIDKQTHSTMPLTNYVSYMLRQSNLVRVQMQNHNGKKQSHYSPPETTYSEVWREWELRRSVW